MNQYSNCERVSKPQRVAGRPAAARRKFFSLHGLKLGLVLYCVRALLVLTYSLSVADIGGPQVDAGTLAWLPFFVVDLPWSWLFAEVPYPSETVALSLYVIAVGLPWILYGMTFYWFGAKIFGSSRIGRATC